MVRKGDILELKISDIGSDGSGIARTDDDLVVFIPYSVPGDIVKAVVRKVKKKYAEAKLLEVTRRSDSRTEPECEYFGVCNGCRIQHLNYQTQLKVKNNTVRNAFERIGGFTGIDFPDTLGSEKIFYYRNKVEFSFSSHRWLLEKDIHEQDKQNDYALGYHMPGFIDKVIDVRRCYLQSETSNRILNLTREFFRHRKAAVYSTRTQKGYLRYLAIRQASGTDDLMVNIVTSYEDSSLIREYSAHISENVPEVTTIVNSLTASRSQVSRSDRYNVITGKGFIEEIIGAYRFKVTPDSFFQTNTAQAARLFERVREMGRFSKGDRVLDLYCGIGAISIFISADAGKITGIETEAGSVMYAKENARLNNADNCEFIASDVKDYLSGLRPDDYTAAVIDPPRSGMHPKSLTYLNDLKIPVVIYVSCNPATQARDIKSLSARYMITENQPVDMFPHTSHVENITRLELKK